MGKRCEGDNSGRRGAVYVLAQVGGAFAGVAAAHAMFGFPIIQISAHVRPTLAKAWRNRRDIRSRLGDRAGVEVSRRSDSGGGGGFITSAYWFTSSTSFANPAVTFARAMTDTFAGISPQSVPLFISGQMIGAVTATLFVRWLLAAPSETLSNPK